MPQRTPPERRGGRDRVSDFLIELALLALIFFGFGGALYLALQGGFHHG